MQTDNGVRELAAGDDVRGDRNAQRQTGLGVILGVLWVAGEATFSLLCREFPALPPFAAIIAVYFVVKLLGDLLCSLTRRSVHEWGYLDDYLINELAFGYSVYAIPLAIAQAIACIYFPAGTLPWRLSASALLAVGVWGVLRRRREYELAHSHKLGRRVRIKHGLGEGNL